ncbi:MAG: hypothetical protein NT152_03355 [Actinobacteria bacterium]|nr:hypothetical protein [Actinomycetota bacterium]
MASTKDFWKSEDGVLESSLVMIPLVITFLIAFQLVIAINYRNIEIATLQSGVSSSALSGEVTNQDQIISLIKKRRSLTFYQNFPFWQMLQIARPM